MEPHDSTCSQSCSLQRDTQPHCTGARRLRHDGTRPNLLPASQTSSWLHPQEAEGSGCPSGVPSLLTRASPASPLFYKAHCQGTVQNNLNPQVFVPNGQTVLEHEEIPLPSSHPVPCTSVLAAQGFLFQEDPPNRTRLFASLSHTHDSALLRWRQWKSKAAW